MILMSTSQRMDFLKLKDIVYWKMKNRRGRFKRSCMEWCGENHIEFIEACASNADIDKGLSVGGGDSQGVERIYGALSAHMWPGMILKSGNNITAPSFIVKEGFLSEEESDYEIEYEVLSVGSTEPWDDGDAGWVSADGLVPAVSARTLAIQTAVTEESNHRSATSCDGENPQASTPFYKATEIVVKSDEHGSADRGTV